MSDGIPLFESIVALRRLRDVSANIAICDPEADCWKDDVAACETAICILTILVGERCADCKQVLDMIQDYKNLSKLWASLHKQLEVAGKPVCRDGAWHCPACHRRATRHHSYCHWCGKRLRWE